MRNYSFIAAAALSVLAASCGNKATVSGVLENAPEKEIVVKQLNVNRFDVLDTIKTTADGSFRYKVDIQEGKPEFVYFFYNGTKVASTLLEKGDKVGIKADTLGNFTSEGSEETAKLQQVERDFSAFRTSMSDIIAKMDASPAASAEYEQYRRDLGKCYVDYYRSRVKFIMENPKSLSVIPVFYQSIGDLAVFSQQTDAVLFSNICDSLRTVYPESKYVKTLGQEARKRQQLLDLNVRIQNAEQKNFPEIELPDIKGKTVKLSEVESKLILLYFWNADDNAQKMYNQDFLKPLYEAYHSQGLEIFQVAMNADKAAWASVVKSQGLEWINVCDIRADASPLATLWNLSSLPVTFLIKDGLIITDSGVSTEDGLRSLVASKLR